MRLHVLDLSHVLLVISFDRVNAFVVLVLLLIFLTLILQLANSVQFKLMLSKSCYRTRYSISQFRKSYLRQAR